MHTNAVAQKLKNIMEEFKKEYFNQIKILCVDDEVFILQALRRVLLRQGVRNLFTANSGKEGLDILKTEHIDVVISDMRMPEMDGVAFLSTVSEQWPETIRILLTGFADMESTINVINRAGIYSYISKPWDENIFLTTLKNAIKQIMSDRELERLQKLTEEQNKELKFVNNNLESLVQEQTGKIMKTNQQLEKALIQLKKSYRSYVPVFSHLINQREKSYEGYYEEILSLIKMISADLSLSENDIENLRNAALLHNIGKLTIPDGIAYKPYNLLSKDEKKVYENYPRLGETTLTALESLEECRKIILAHKEHYDGSGFPQKITGSNIPLGARILCIVVDYAQLKRGLITPNMMTPDQAFDLMFHERKKFYDPDILEIFRSYKQKSQELKQLESEAKMSAESLKPGMVLSRPVITFGDVLLLPAGYELDEKSINHLVNFIGNSTEPLDIYIQT